MQEKHQVIEFMPELPQTEHFYQAPSTLQVAVVSLLSLTVVRATRKLRLKEPNEYFNHQTLPKLE